MLEGFTKLICFPAGKCVKTTSWEAVASILQCFLAGKQLPVGKHFPVMRSFPAWKHFPVGKRLPNSRLRSRMTIWRNLSKRHENLGTFPEGNLLEFCEIFTPVHFNYDVTCTFIVHSNCLDGSCQQFPDTSPRPGEQWFHVYIETLLHMAGWLSRISAAWSNKWIINLHDNTWELRTLCARIDVIMISLLTAEPPLSTYILNNVNNVYNVLFNRLRMCRSESIMFWLQITCWKLWHTLLEEHTSVYCWTN